MPDEKKIARYYVESANPDGAALPGVPLGDIDVSTFDALPVWLQLSIDASPFFRKTPIKEADKKGAAKDDSR